ncbi:translocation/assembly module TamB domain-containing protein [Ideonella livida]|uniref:Translocation and assembly module TamB C-terminal domain-containing protein n=1 Tax=Ideonella livida TaxID=2707176 RepID=A0A7C9THX3_9BURK|nr:translocation/assembly module TamB domain-containing protein [Ideonella livida]NDY89823.1 hypothetical protein [Ideonella livida]
MPAPSPVPDDTAPLGPAPAPDGPATSPTAPPVPGSAGPTGAPPPSPPTRARRVWQALVQTLGGAITRLALLLALPVVVLAALLGTATGSRWLLSSVPGLQVEGLAQPLLGSRQWTVERLRWQGQAGELQVQALEVRLQALDWTAWGLPALQLDLLAARQVTWRSAPADHTTPSAPPTDLRLPAALRIEQIAVERLEVDQAPALTGLQAELDLGHGQPDHHRLQLRQLDLPQARLQGELTLGALAPLPVSLQLEARGRSPAAGHALAWNAQARLDGPLARPTLRASLQGRWQGLFQRAQAEAVLQPLRPWPVERLWVETRELDLNTLATPWPATRLDARLELQAQGPDQPVQARLRLDNRRPGRLDAGQLPLRRLDLALDSRLSTPAGGGAPQLEALQLRQLDLDWDDGQGRGGRLRGSGAYGAEGGQGSASLRLALERWRVQTVGPTLSDMRLDGPLQLSLHGLPTPASWLAPPPTTLEAQPGPLPPSPGRPAAGNARRWEARLQAALTGALTPEPASAPAGQDPPTAAALPLQVSAQALLGPRSLQLRQLHLQAGEASAHLSGQVQREAGQRWRWDLQARTTAFDPRLWLPAGLAASLGRGEQRWNLEARSQAGVDLSRLLDSHQPWQQRLQQGLQGSAHVALGRSQWQGVQWQGELDWQRAALGTQARLQLQVGRNQLDLGGQLPTDPEQPDLPPRWTLQADLPQPDQLDALAQVLLPASVRERYWPRQGALLAEAQAQGLPGELQWSARLQAPEWQARDLQLQALRLHSEGRWQGEHLQTVGALSADRLASPGWPAALQALSLQWQGSPQQHQISLAMQADQAPPEPWRRLLGSPLARQSRLRLELAGRWQAEPTRSEAPAALAAATVPPSTAPLAPGEAVTPVGDTAGSRWQAEFKRLQLDSPDAPGPVWLDAQGLQLNLALDREGRPLGLALAPGGLALAGASLRWSELQWQPRPGPGLDLVRADVQLDPLAAAPWLQRLMPEMGWQGDLLLGGQARVRLQPGSAPRLALSLERLSGDLSLAEDLRAAGQGAQALGLNALRLGLDADSGQWRSSLGLAGQALGELALAVQAQPGDPGAWPAADTPVSGVMQGRVASLGVWSAWVPAGWRLGGEVNAQAQLAGTLGQPQLTGTVQGEGLSFRHMLQGLHFQRGRVDLTLEGTEIALRALHFESGQGEVNGQGRAWLDGTPRAALTVQARAFQLQGRVDRRLVTSGEIQLALRPDALQARGDLRLDSGYVDVSHGNAPELDDDVELLGADSDATTAPANARAPRRTNLQQDVALTLDLGENFVVRGRGLDSELRGTLRLTTPENRLRLQGEVNTQGGTYAAYGQKLRVDRGQVLFYGPLEDPRLDIFAVRSDLDSLKVGVAITGTALNPHVRLASEPDMTDPEKLSWLLLGRATDGLGQADVELLQKAALALLAGEGEGVVEGLIKNFGLSDFAVRQETDGDVRATVVSVGKQLTRRWYVGYERSVNATAGTWQLIYRAAQRYTVRAQSGTEERSLDLVWTWRWD